MRQALRIGGGVVAVGLVAYAVIALSSSSSGTRKASEKKRARAAVEARDTDADEDETPSKRAVRKPAAPAKRPDVDRTVVPPPPPTPSDAPVRYEEAYDEFEALVEEVEGMASRGEHLSQARFVELYRKGDNLTVALMRTPEVMGSDNVRSQLSKLNQRFRMKMSQIGPLPAEQ